MFLVLLNLRDCWGVLLYLPTTTKDVYCDKWPCIVTIGRLLRPSESFLSGFLFLLLFAVSSEPEGIQTKFTALYCSTFCTHLWHYIWKCITLNLLTLKSKVLRLLTRSSCVLISLEAAVSVVRVPCRTVTAAANVANRYRLLAGPSGRAVWGVCLRPLACWDCGFESHRSIDVCLLWVLCVVR